MGLKTLNNILYRLHKKTESCSFERDFSFKITRIIFCIIENLCLAFDWLYKGKVRSLVIQNQCVIDIRVFVSPSSIRIYQKSTNNFMDLDPIPLVDNHAVCVIIHDSRMKFLTMAQFMENNLKLLMHSRMKIFIIMIGTKIQDGEGVCWVLPRIFIE